MQLILLLLFVPAVLSQGTCLLSKEKGDTSCGEGGKQSFYFDKHTKRCQPFYYKGCNGNDNRFATREECLGACENAKESDAPHTEAVCASGAYASGATVGEPDACDSCPKGYKCEGKLCCPTKEFVCHLQYDAGRFGASGHHTPRYFFSKAFNNCMLFTFYGRAGNANNFGNYNQCKDFCT